MKRLLSLCLLGIFSSFVAFASSWSDSLSINIRTSVANPAQVNPTKFRLWIPQEATDCKAILLVSARGVGFNNGADGSGIYGRGNDFKFALNPIIREAVRAKKMAVVCFQGQNDDGLVTNFDPGLGHADSLLKAIRSLSVLSSHPELEFIPWIAFGHSLGSVFSQNVALWNPGKVAASIIYKAGGFVDQPTWTSPFNPGMNLNQVPVLFCNGELEGPDINNNSPGFLAEAVFNRVKTERQNLRPHHQIIRRNGSHSIIMPDEAKMMALFIQKAFDARIPATSGPATGPVALLNVSESAGWLGNLSSFQSFDPVIQSYAQANAQNQFWLFDEEYARKWKQFHESPISFSLSRTGPFCNGDTLTVYYQVSDTGFFGPHNSFRLEMSSIRGDFDRYSFPFRIPGQSKITKTSGSFKVKMPNDLQRAPSVANGTPNRYRFRLVSTQPVYESNNNGEQTISLCNPASGFNLFTYLTNGGSPTLLCQGTTDSISVSVGRLPVFTLGASNQLIFELSDSLGNFSFPTLLKTISTQITGGGSSPNIRTNVGLPPGIQPGNGYKIRARSTEPPYTSAETGTQISVIKPGARVASVLAPDGSLVLSAPLAHGYQWYEDNNPIPGAIFQSLQVPATGNFFCQLSKGNCTETTDTLSVTETRNPIKGNETVSLYPNPAGDFFNLVSPENESIYGVEIMDISGRTLRKFQGKRLQKIYCADLKAGVYLLKIKTTKGVQFARLVVRK